MIGICLWIIKRNELKLMEKVMKIVYETLPNIDFILYMLRGEAR